MLNIGFKNTLPTANKPFIISIYPIILLTLVWRISSSTLKPFINILLYPLESLPLETQECYTKRDCLSEENCLTQYDKFYEEKGKQEELLSNSFPQVFCKEDKTIPPPYWVIQNNISFRKGNIDEKTQEWLDDMEKCSYEFEAEKYIQVILPE